MANKIIKLALFVICGWISIFLALLGLIFTTGVGFTNIAPNALHHTIELMYLRQILCVSPLILFLIGTVLLVKKISKFIRIPVIAVLLLISINFFYQAFNHLNHDYLQWQSFINDYKYSNTSNPHYSMDSFGGFGDNLPYAIIKFDTSDSPNTVKDFYLNNPPPGITLTPKDVTQYGKEYNNETDIGFTTRQGNYEVILLKPMSSGGTTVAIKRSVYTML